MLARRLAPNHTSEASHLRPIVRTTFLPFVCDTFEHRAGYTTLLVHHAVLVAIMISYIKMQAAFSVKTSPYKANHIDRNGGIGSLQQIWRYRISAVGHQTRDQSTAN